MSGILFVWAAGSVAGPVLSGLAMSLGGPQALFGLAAFGLFLLALILLVRSRVRPPPAAVAPEAFIPAKATSVAVPVLGPSWARPGPVLGPSWARLRRGRREPVEHRAHNSPHTVSGERNDRLRDTPAPIWFPELVI